jgi:hypothetical protein
MDPVACQPNTLQAELGGSIASGVPKLHGVFKDSLGNITNVGTRLCELVSGLVRKLKELRLKSQTRPCLCELVSDLVRKPVVQKSSIQGFQMALCPSGANKKLMLTVCFSCFSIPILKEI